MLLVEHGWEALRELEVKGNYFGEFSLGLAVYDLELAKIQAGW